MRWRSILWTKRSVDTLLRSRGFQRNLVKAADDLDPAAVRIGDEVEAHTRILLHDAAHLLVKGMECVVVVHADAHMGGAVAVVVRALKTAVPCKLELEVGLVVADEDDEPGAILGSLAATFLQTERLLVERKRGVEIVYVGVAMDELGVQKEDCIYVGDSDVDFKTATNTGLKCISCLWGFRTKDELISAGVKDNFFVTDPLEILDLV